MNTTTKILVPVAILAIGGLAVAWYTGVFNPAGNAAASAAAAGGGAPPPVPVSVAPVLEKTVTEWDEFSGRIQSIDSVEIRPQVSGIIEAVHFDEGQLVKKGDPLFTIDQRPFQAELAHAQADLAGAQAKLALANTNLERNKQLIQTHAIAQSELDQRNDDVLEADAAVKAAQAAVLAAQINLNYTSITAPVDGRVSRAEITAGNYVGTGATPPVLTSVVSVNPVYVEFEVDEQTFLKYAANGAAGNTGIENIPVSMGLANEDGYPHQGHLRSIDNRLDTSSGTIRVRAVFDNPNGELTPGLYAKVRTGNVKSAPTILVDDRAIGTDQDKKFVLVIGADNKATYRNVTLGPIVDGLRVIRSGLQKNEKIIVNGLQRVRPNSIVAPTEVAMKATLDDDGVAASAAK
jgi:multidrug efflux system membrane fusion protein